MFLPSAILILTKAYPTKAQSTVILCDGTCTEHAVLHVEMDTLFYRNKGDIYILHI
jgi:hypothetical protein